MLAALAGVWLLVFVPSWMSSSQDRDVRRNERQAALENRKAELDRIRTLPILKNAARARRAKSLKRVTGFVSLAFLVSLGWSLAVMVSYSQWWIWSVVSAGGLIISVALNQRAEKSFINAVSQSTKSSTRLKFGVPSVDVSANQSTEAELEILDDPRAWVATGVPSQLYRSATGTLENPKFAEVLDFADELEKRDDKTPVTSDTSSINIDEILRRRRANG